MGLMYKYRLSHLCCFKLTYMEAHISEWMPLKMTEKHRTKGKGAVHLGYFLPIKTG